MELNSTNLKWRRREKSTLHLSRLKTSGLLGAERLAKRENAFSPINERTRLGVVEVSDPSLEKRGYSFNDVCRD